MDEIGVTRSSAWLVHIVIAILLIPLALLIETDKKKATDGDGPYQYEYSREGIHAAWFLLLVLIGLILIYMIDVSTSPTDDVRDDLKDFKKEVDRIKQKKLKRHDAEAVTDVAVAALAEVCHPDRWYTVVIRVLTLT